MHVKVCMESWVAVKEEGNKKMVKMEEQSKWMAKKPCNNLLTVTLIKHGLHCHSCLPFSLSLKTFYIKREDVRKP